MTERLQGKAALIFGAGSVGEGWGNGRATAAVMLREGARVFGTDVDGMVRTVKKRFSHMGDVTTRMFLSAVGAIEYSSWQPTDRQRQGRS